jgi:2-keto-3-deoxy-6-phosphogluconate aldolase
MHANNDGYHFLKFFPATAAGGLPLLKAWASVFGDVVFCPTGGHHGGHRTAVSFPAQCGGLRRLVVDASGPDAQQRLGGSHTLGT